MSQQSYRRSMLATMIVALAILTAILVTQIRTATGLDRVLRGFGFDEVVVTPAR